MSLAAWAASSSSFRGSGPNCSSRNSVCLPTTQSFNTRGRWRAELAAFPEVPGIPDEEKSVSLARLKARFARDLALNDVKKSGLLEEDIEWFLRDRRYDVDEAEEKLRKVAVFRRDYALNVTEDDIAAEAATGKSRVLKSKATLGRPVLVVNVEKHITGEFPLESTKKLVAYQVQGAVDMLSPGDETIMTIIDMRGFSLRSADIKFVKYLVDVFFIYYPRRTSEVVLVSPPMIFRPTWAIVKPLLRKYASLVKFVKVPDVPSYFANKDDVPKEFL